MVSWHLRGETVAKKTRCLGFPLWKSGCVFLLSVVSVAATDALALDSQYPISVDEKSDDGEIIYRTGQASPAAKAGEEWFLFMYPGDDQKPDGPFVTEKVRIPANPEAVGTSTLPAMALPEVVAVTVRPAHVAGRVIPATFIQKSAQYEMTPAHHPGAVFKNEERSVVVAPAHIERKWKPAVFDARDMDIRAAANRGPSALGVVDTKAGVKKPAAGDAAVDPAQTVRIYELMEPGSVEEIAIPEKRMTVVVRVVEKAGDASLDLVPAEMGEYRVRELMEPSSVVLSQIPAEVVWLRVYSDLPEVAVKTALLPFRYADFVRPDGHMTVNQLEQARIVWRKRAVPVPAAAATAEIPPILTRQDWDRILNSTPTSGQRAALLSSIQLPREEPVTEFAVGPTWPALLMADLVEAGPAFGVKEALAKAKEHADKGRLIQARPYWEFAAKRHDAEAWYLLGEGAKTGVFGDGQIDPKRAEACWLAAARLDSPNAWLALGDLYASGQLGAPDWNRAVDAWIEAFNHKNSVARTPAYKRMADFVKARREEIAPGGNRTSFEREAVFNLLQMNHPRLASVFLSRLSNRSGEEYFAEAIIAHNGWNAAGRPDHAEARSLFTAAANRYHQNAKKCLAALMEPTAREALVRRAETGDLSATVQLAQYAYSFDDFAAAAAYARQAIDLAASAGTEDIDSEDADFDADRTSAPKQEASAEYAAALRILGLTLDKADPEWYMRRPASGLARRPAPEVRARLNRTGLLLLERAAMLGDVDALYEVGNAYRHGQRGVAINTDRAFAAFERASALNDARAMLALAEMFDKGEIGRSDPIRAYTLATALLKRRGLEENAETVCKRIQTSCGRRFPAKRLEACAAQADRFDRADNDVDRARAFEQIVWRSEGFLPERPTRVKLPEAAITAVPVILAGDDGARGINSDEVPVLFLSLSEAQPASMSTPVKDIGERDPDADAPNQAAAGDKADEASLPTPTAIPVEQPFVSGRPPVAKPGETWQLYTYPAVLFRRGGAWTGRDKAADEAVESAAAWMDDGSRTACTLREAVTFLRPVATEYREYQVDLPVSAPYHDVGTVMPERFRAQKMVYEYRPAYRPGAEFVERDFEVVLHPAYTKKTWVPVEFSEPEEKRVILVPARREWLTSFDANSKTNPVLYTLRENKAKIEAFTFEGVKTDGYVKNENIPAVKKTLKRLEMVKDGDPAQPLRPAQMAEYTTQVQMEPAEVRIREDVVKTRRITASRDNRDSAFDYEKWPKVVRDIPGDIVAVEPARMVWRKVSSSDGQGDEEEPAEPTAED